MQTASALDRRAVLISGTVGSGKTRTALAVGRRLQDQAVPHAVIDLDWLRCSWPAPPDDPFSTRLEARNLGCVARTFLDAGARRVIMAGVVETAASRAMYQEAVGVPLTVVRLRVDLTTVRSRLAVRHRDDNEALTWHLDRSGTLDAILERAGVDDVTIDVGTAAASEVATSVLRAIGWDEPVTPAHPAPPTR